jgi:hypothetical protein
MNIRRLVALSMASFLFAGSVRAATKPEPRFTNSINVVVPHISTDKSVRYDYDIVYVRAPRAGDSVNKRFYTDFSQPVTMEPGADLMLLHTDGSEELLVAGGEGSITDPMVSFDGQWVYFTHLYQMQQANQWSPSRQGADIFKIHAKTRRVVRLTGQTFTPNTGAANWSDDFRTPRAGRSHFDYGVFNMGPCPLPGGRIVFTSNRDGFRPSKGYPAIALQLFVMDDSDEGPGRNVEKIGYLNIAGALHARIAGPAQRYSLGPLDNPARRHGLGATGQRVRPGRRAERIPFSNATIGRFTRGRGILHSKQLRVRRLHQTAVAPAVWRARVRSRAHEQQSAVALWPIL